jgi:hypothetical protein
MEFASTLPGDLMEFRTLAIFMSKTLASLRMAMTPKRLLPHHFSFPDQVGPSRENRHKKFTLSCENNTPAVELKCLLFALELPE